MPDVGGLPENAKNILVIGAGILALASLVLLGGGLGMIVLGVFQKKSLVEGITQAGRTAIMFILMGVVAAGFFAVVLFVFNRAMAPGSYVDLFNSFPDLIKAVLKLVFPGIK